MAETTFTFKDAIGTTKTALAGANGSTQLAPAAVLYALDGTQLIGQKARAASLPVALSSEDAALLADLLTSTAFAAADPATQTTLAAILAKIIAAPATEAKQDALAALIGEVQASPTSNTLQDRLKTIASALAGTLAISAASLPLPTGAASETTLSALNTKIPASPATAGNQTTANTSLASLETKIGEVQASPTANTVLDRLKALLTGIVLAAGDNLIGRFKVSDGTTVATVRNLGTNHALNVSVQDGSGNQITSFGGTTTRTPTGTMTRPSDTTAYAAGDGVTTATSSASAMTVSSAARTSAGGGVIFGGKASKSTTSTTNAQFRIWIYQDTPSAIPNDNAAFTAAVQADYQKLVGTALIDFSAGVTGSDGVRVPIVLERPNMAFKVASGTDLIVIWEARAAYTPGSAEVFRLSLDIAQD